MADARRASPPIRCRPAQRLIVTIGVMMAVLLQVLDTTIANVALPHMQASLSATQDTINWVLTSYIVASAIALADQRLARRQGRAQAAAADLGRGVHRRFRAVRDRDVACPRWCCSARFRASAARSSCRSPRRHLFDINPREKHGQAMALFGGGVMIGPILGPVLGGWLTDNYNWRWVFLVNLPVGIICALLMAALHAQDRDA